MPQVKFCNFFESSFKILQLLKEQIIQNWQDGTCSEEVSSFLTETFVFDRTFLKRTPRANPRRRSDCNLFTVLCKADIFLRSHLVGCQRCPSQRLVTVGKTIELQNRKFFIEDPDQNKLYKSKYRSFAQSLASSLKVDFHFCVIFSYVSKIEAMYERPRESVKVEECSTFTFPGDPPYISSILFTHEKITP